MRPTSASRTRNFRHVLPGKHCEAGVVLHRLGKEAFRVGGGQRHLDSITHVPLGCAVGVLHLDEDVERQALRATSPGQLELAAGNLDSNRDEILGSRHLEVVQLQRDGDIRDRVLEHQRVFELALTLDAVLLLPLLVSEIPRTMRQRHLPRAVLEANLYATVLSVVRRMRAVESEDVVAGLGLSGLTDTKREVVVIHERLAARVLREREVGVLRPLQARNLLLRERPGEHADAARRTLIGVAERRHRNEPARVDRKDLDVRANRGVGGGAHLRHVVGAVQTQPGREEDERLLLRQRTQHRHRRLQRRQLPVGGEDVELAVVLAECRAEVLEVELAVAVGVLAVGQHVEDVRELTPVVGEILLHP